MSYREFTFRQIERQFGLDVVEVPDLFAEAAEAGVSPSLMTALNESLQLASDINTEKARSELVIAPILMEVRFQLKRRIGLFSGVEFSVAPDQGLDGTCDFLLTRSPLQLFIRSPILVVVEAKNEDMKSGMAQCAASLVAARLFNEREGAPTKTVYGAVTTGTIWRFLQLDLHTISVDRREYFAYNELPKIIGIMTSMFAGGTPEPIAALVPSGINRPTVSASAEELP